MQYIECKYIVPVMVKTGEVRSKYESSASHFRRIVAYEIFTLEREVIQFLRGIRKELF